MIVAGTGNNYVRAGNGSNLVVGGLGQHTIQRGNGRNILIDGAATVSPSVPGDSLLQSLAAWNGGAAGSSLRPRLDVTYYKTRANVLTSGTGPNDSTTVQSGHVVR